MIAPLPEISIVIPARDEVVAIGPLLEEIGRVVNGRDFEVIVIDDGSRDGTHHVLAGLAARHPWMSWHRNADAVGQSAAIRWGVRVARASLVVTLDGDGQNPPDQIPNLLAPFAAPDSTALGLVQGERKNRHDSAGKRWASHAANAIRGWLLRDGTRDSGCGLKAFRREAYLDLPWFDHIHRFMPAMMLREGWEVATVPVTHRARVGGQSKYTNFARALVGVPDLAGAAWLIRRAGPPRHLPRRKCDPSSRTALLADPPAEQMPWTSPEPAGSAQPARSP